jgi:NAD(P)-dependent dehydrogenase (short-subunit alcohol dehydrogenase family)/acyl carrier protein
MALPGDSFSVDENGDYRLDPADPAQFRQLLDQVYDSLGGAALRGVTYLWSADQDEVMAAPGEALSATGPAALHLVQALVGSDAGKSPSLCLVTRGSQDAGEEGVSDPAGATFWGMARVLVQEHPDLPVRCVDLPVDPQAMKPADLLQDIYADSGEDMVAYRQGQRLVARLVRYREASPDKRLELPIRGDASYLVTGGTGGLGLRVARWLVENGARNLVLSSRSGTGEELESLQDELTADGARVEVVACDVGDADSLAQLLATFGAEMPPLKGVIHAAGALDDGMLAQQSWDRFLNAYRAKVDGTWNLHQQTSDLDFLVCFSSATALLGAPGQGNYAAANAYMDSLMRWRRARGMHGLSINWGPWAEAGMAATLGERDRRRATEQGWSRIEADTGLSILSELLRTGPAQVGVLPLHWGKFSEALFEAGLPGYLKAWQPRASGAANSASTGAGGAGSGGEAVLSASPEQREDRLRDYVIGVVGNLLGHEDIDTMQGFTEMGMDSLMGVDLRAILQKSLKVSLASTFAFDHSNVEAVVAYLMDKLFEDASVQHGGSADQVAQGDPGLGGTDLEAAAIDDSIEAELAALEQELGTQD